jgi:hypothetical protein
MRRNRRFFRGMTWIAGLSCLLILIAWWWSMHHSAMYVRNNWCLRLFAGQMSFMQSAQVARGLAAHNETLALQKLKDEKLSLREWYNKEVSPADSVESFWSVWPISSNSLGFSSWSVMWEPWHRSVILPLWMVFCAMVGGAVLCGWLSRFRRRRSHCAECDYCLTGNTTGICPECGAAIPEGCVG